MNWKALSRFWVDIMTIADDTRYCRPFHVTTNQIEDELLALNLETSSYYGVDGIGTQVWRLLIDERMAVAEACAALREQYAVDAETCQREVRAFVEQLIDARLLEVAAA